MHYFGERLIRALPLVVLLSAACSSESLTPTTDAGATPDATGPTMPPPDAPAATTLNVSIPPGAGTLGPGGYVPNPATITVGSTVMWMNNDSVSHTTTSMTGVWDSGPIPPGGTFSHTFTQAGTFPYFCTIHGAAAQNGVIMVQ
jgi:plastocyanin